MYYEKRTICPIDKKRCNAEGHLHGTDYSGVSGVCRYGYFDEDDKEPRNCDLKHPRTKPYVFNMKKSMLSDLRQHGLHEEANRRTETINPKKEYKYLNWLREKGKYTKNIQDRKKKSTKIKSKRKTCSCKKK